MTQSDFDTNKRDRISRRRQSLKTCRDVILPDGGEILINSPHSHLSRRRDLPTARAKGTRRRLIENTIFRFLLNYLSFSWSFTVYWGALYHYTSRHVSEDKSLISTDPNRVKLARCCYCFSGGKLQSQSGQVFRGLLQRYQTRHSRTFPRIPLCRSDALQPRLLHAHLLEMLPLHRQKARFVASSRISRSPLSPLLWFSIRNRSGL